MAENTKPDFATLTVQLLSAYFVNNSVPSDNLAGLVRATREALAGDPIAIGAVAVEAAQSPGPEPVQVKTFEPAVSIADSLASRDHIVSLIDGRRYKALKRHLSTHDLTPVSYRERYGLAHDYPMVAPSYSDARRETAKRMGLGRIATTGQAAHDADTPEPDQANGVAAFDAVVSGRSRKSATKPVVAGKLQAAKSEAAATGPRKSKRTPKAAAKAE